MSLLTKVCIPLDQLKKDYFVDCYGDFFASKIKTVNDANEDEQSDNDSDHQERVGGYDLEDPFIDDTELPAGFSLAELMANGSDSEEELSEIDAPILPYKDERPVVPKTEYYVWKGKLPAREVDPLLLEKLERKVKKSRKRKVQSKKRKSAEKDTSGTSKKRPRKEKESVEKDKKKSSTSSSKEAKLSDRIARLGQADEEEEEDQVQSDPTNIVVDDESKKNELEVVVEGGEERVRRRIERNKPFNELELRLALEELKAEAEKTSFDDPKKFPSSLRQLCTRAICCQLRLQDKKTDLIDEFLNTMASILPFHPSSLERLFLDKMIPFYVTELRSILIPDVMDRLKNEIEIHLMETGTVSGGDQKKYKMNDAIKEQIYLAVNLELDLQALDRLVTFDMKNENYSEFNIRKAMYAKLALLWPEGTISRVQVGAEYSAYRKKLEMKALKEHGIEVVPQLKPVSSKSKLNSGATVENTATTTSVKSVNISVGVKTEDRNISNRIRSVTPGSSEKHSSPMQISSLIQ